MVQKQYNFLKYKKIGGCLIRHSSRFSKLKTVKTILFVSVKKKNSKDNESIWTQLESSNERFSCPSENEEFRW